MMSNSGGLHERQMLSIIDALEGLGGLMELALGAGFAVYLLVMPPFS
jgi:hypothetical protein